MAERRRPWNDVLPPLSGMAPCPKCQAEYPDYHVMKGSLHTLCDQCGYSSEDDA